MTSPAIAAMTTMFDYLDRLRDSGATNMFGATPYIQQDFNKPRDQASKILKVWMETFDGKSTAAERAEKAVNDGMFE